MHKKNSRLAFAYQKNSLSNWGWLIFFPFKKIFNGGSDRCIGLLEKIKTISFFFSFQFENVWCPKI